MFWSHDNTKQKTVSMYNIHLRHYYTFHISLWAQKVTLLSCPVFVYCKEHLLWHCLVRGDKEHFYLTSSLDWTVQLSARGEGFCMDGIYRLWTQHGFMCRWQHCCTYIQYCAWIHIYLYSTPSFTQFEDLFVYWFVFLYCNVCFFHRVCKKLVRQFILSDYYFQVQEQTLILDFDIDDLHLLSSLI